MCLVMAALALAEPSLPRATKGIRDGLWVVLWLAFTFLIGLRDHVGPDWDAYERIFYDVRRMSLSETLAYQDPGYSLLNWLVGRLGGDLYVVNTISAGIFMAGLIRICRRQHRPLLSLALATPMLMIVLGMSITRQTAALGVIMFAIPYLEEKRLTRYVVLILVASLFHRSAILLIPMAALVSNTKISVKAFAILAVFVLIYFAGAKARFDIYFDRYVLTEQRDPAGVVARLMMNAAPAVLFLWRRKIYDLPKPAHALWTWFSIFTLCMFPLLIILPSPIIVDRFSIYFTPIQMIAYSGYVEAAARRRFPFRAFHVPGLLVLYGLAFWIWLYLGVRSEDWLPYRNTVLGFLS
jgi:hypothetical protein